MVTAHYSGLFAGLRAPKEIIFGSGQRRSLPGIIERLGQRVLLCLDGHLLDHPEIAPILQQIEQRGVSLRIVSDVVPEIPLENIVSAVEVARAHEAELVVAIGGGSSIDLAKMVACQMAHSTPLRDFYGEFAVPGPVLPLVAVPTTAGTGSEVTPVAVLTDTERGVKVGVSSPYLIPTIALCDPELTITCPPGVTSAAGTDALAHCIESYTAVRHHPEPGIMDSRVFIGASRLTSALALEGIRAIVGSLHAAYSEPENLSARESVMYGSMLGGLAFGTAGNAAAHALQYPIGAETKTAHGVGIGLLLPYVMQYNLSHRQPEFARIGAIFGATEGDQAALAEQAPQLVQDYVASLGIPSGLTEIGFSEERIDWAAEQGIGAVRLSENNPRSLDIEGARTILRAAFEGSLESAS